MRHNRKEGKRHDIPSGQTSHSRDGRNGRGRRAGVADRCVRAVSNARKGDRYDHVIRHHLLRVVGTRRRRQRGHQRKRALEVPDQGQRHRLGPRSGRFGAAGIRLRIQRPVPAHQGHRRQRRRADHDLRLRRRRRRQAGHRVERRQRQPVGAGLPCQRRQPQEQGHRLNHAATQGRVVHHRLQPGDHQRRRGRLRSDRHVEVDRHP